MFNQGFYNPELWRSGPIPGQFYNFPGGNGYVNANATNAGKQHTASPITTGTSVVGIKFDGGVMVAADNLVSYGSLARFQDMQRVFPINNNTVLGAGGDFADFQSLKLTLDQKMNEDTWYESNDNNESGLKSTGMRPRALYTWLTRVMYNRRSRINPLWLDLVVGGLDESGTPFLGHVDMRGRAYEDKAIVTGFGKHLALPVMREFEVPGQELLTFDRAYEAMRKCMEVLYYRDCRAMPVYSLVTCTSSGCTLRTDLKVDQDWRVATHVRGY